VERRPVESLMDSLESLNQHDEDIMTKESKRLKALMFLELIICVCL